MAFQYLTEYKADGDAGEFHQPERNLVNATVQCSTLVFRVQ